MMEPKDRPVYGLTEEELAQVRALITGGPDDESSSAAADAEAIDAAFLEALVLAPDFGLPKNLRVLTPSNIREVLTRAAKLAKRKAEHGAAALKRMKRDTAMRTLEERETMSRTIHFAFAKHYDAKALAERFTTHRKEADVHVVEFLERQCTMGALLAQLFMTDLLIRIGITLHEPKFIALAEDKLAEHAPAVIASVRDFIEANAALIAGSLHVKIAAEELLTLLTERPPSDALNVFYTAVCMRYADLVSADFQPFNSWRIAEML